MAVRTNKDKVEKLLARNYDSSIDLGQFIRHASAIVARVITCAATKSVTLTSLELETIETYLAAYFYTKSDPLYTSKSTGGASGSYFRGQIDPFLEAAQQLDPSGCVKAIMAQNRVDLVWLGKPESDQIPYADRS